MKTGKTFLNRTALWWLSSAKYDLSKAGIPEIFIDVPNYGVCTVNLSKDGILCLRNADGLVARLRMHAHARILFDYLAHRRDTLGPR